jgi:hypothetical protein
VNSHFPQIAKALTELTVAKSVSSTSSPRCHREGIRNAYATQMLVMRELNMTTYSPPLAAA